MSYGGLQNPITLQRQKDKTRLDERGVAPQVPPSHTPAPTLCASDKSIGYNAIQLLFVFIQVQMPG